MRKKKFKLTYLQMLFIYTFYFQSDSLYLLFYLFIVSISSPYFVTL